jgi:predicted MPP superfamily phosphohydrolase
LINRNSMLRIRGEKFAIAATDHVWLGKPDPSLALRGVSPDVPVLALVHEPDYFDEMSSFRNLLQISGHTHGGQCRVPFLDFTPAKVRHGRKYIQGPFSRGESRLFVTRGLGTTGLRVRFACPPEVALLTLRA